MQGSLSPSAGTIPSGQAARGLAVQPRAQGSVHACDRVCVSQSLPPSAFQALQAESTNLFLIKMALCNITYMSLHLTPIILRKAQALFQPVGLRASGADLPGT